MKAFLKNLILVIMSLIVTSNVVAMESDLPVPAKENKITIQKKNEEFIRLFKDRLPAELQRKVIDHLVVNRSIVDQVLSSIAIQPRTFEGHTAMVYGAVLSPDGTTLASSAGFGANVIKLWDIKSGKCIRTFSLNNNSTRASLLTYSPDGTTLAFGCGPTINLWDCKSSTVKTIPVSNDVLHIVYSPDGISVAFECGNDLKFWNTQTNTLKTLKGHASVVQKIAYNSDGTILISGSADGTIKIWDLVSDVCTKTLVGGNDFTNVFAVSPDETTLITTSGNDIKLRKFKSGEIIKTLKGHTEIISSLVYIDNNTIASGSFDGTIKLWDLISDTCIMTWNVSSPNLIYNPKSQVLVSFMGSPKIYVWDLSTFNRIKQSLEQDCGEEKEFHYLASRAITAIENDSHNKKKFALGTGYKKIFKSLDPIIQKYYKNRLKFISK